MLGAADRTTVVVSTLNRILHLHVLRPYSCVNIYFRQFGATDGPNHRHTRTHIHIYWVDKLFLFSGLIRRTWYLMWPSSRNKTMTLVPPSSQCSSLLNLGHFHARTDAVSSFFLTLLRSDTPRIVSFSFTGIIGTCWKSFTP